MVCIFFFQPKKRFMHESFIRYIIVGVHSQMLWREVRLVPAVCQVARHGQLFQQVDFTLS